MNSFQDFFRFAVSRVAVRNLYSPLFFRCALTSFILVEQTILLREVLSLYWWVSSEIYFKCIPGFVVRGSIFPEIKLNE